jgi:flagellar basal-body rod protein FlgG
MVYGIYLSATGLQTNQYRQEILANNLANLETAGFKQDLAVIRERPIETREDAVDPRLSQKLLDPMTGGSLVAPTYTTFEQGMIEKTGNPLDVALQGDGFFVVEDHGAERYTRDGRFTVSDEGDLVTVSGHHVLDESGAPIVLPPETEGEITIDGNGYVRVGKAILAKLRTVRFDDNNLLRKTGGNLFQAIGAAPERVDLPLEIGAVERSTVEPTRAMVDMMQVSRLYEMNAQMIGLADSTLGRAVNDIARIR